MNTAAGTIQSGGQIQAMPGGPGGFKNYANTQEEEDAFDLRFHRQHIKATGVVGSIANLAKGALGAGVLSSHVSYKKAGYQVALVLTISFGIYMGYCFATLIRSAQMLYKRSRVPIMSYPDIGEASCACHPNPKIQKWGKRFRYIIDFTVCLELFGACAAYHLIIAKTIKQIVEDKQEDEYEGPNGFNLRVYLALICLPLILLCWIRTLKYLAPFSILGNIFILITLICTIYYAVKNNPKFEDLKPFTSLYPFLEFVGIAIFSMSFAGIVIPVENNLKDPYKFTKVLWSGLVFVIITVLIFGLFGYAAFKDKVVPPITLNFPLTTEFTTSPIPQQSSDNISGRFLTTLVPVDLDLIPPEHPEFPKILKGCVALMIFCTHALNFWTPFNLLWVYIKKRHNPNKLVFWEIVWRTFFVIAINLLAIAFPKINALVGLLGGFCLCNMAFLFPHIIELLVYSYRPGFGKKNWRLIKCSACIIFGTIMLFAATAVNLYEYVRPDKK